MSRGMGLQYLGITGMGDGPDMGITHHVIDIMGITHHVMMSNNSNNVYACQLMISLGACMSSMNLSLYSLLMISGFTMLCDI